MSRKIEKLREVEGEEVPKERTHGGGGNGEFFKNCDDDEAGMEQVVVQVEKDEEDDDEVDNKNEEENRQLLGAENAGALGVQGISATCQSIAAEERVESTSSLRKKDGQRHDHKQQRNFPDGVYYYEYGTTQRKNSVPNALLTLILVLFNLVWSAGLTYWHFYLNNFDVAVASLVIIALSGSITTIAFFTGRTRKRYKSSQNKMSCSSNTTEVSCSARTKLWRCSKVAWLLAAVPCLVPVILAGAYFISSVLEKRAQWSGSNSSSASSTTAIATSHASGGNEQRQCAKSNATTITSTGPSATHWLAASGSFFLIESLTLCFPFFVLHLTLLMENSDMMPSVIGLYTLLGLFVLSFSITFSRFQFDRLQKPDRFGERAEMYLRFGYLWSAKIIWLVTFSIIIVTVRLLYPGRGIEATAGAVAGLTAIHEIPLWMCLLPPCGKIAAKLSGLFFLIPQFTSLISLIYWVNADPLIYQTNIGSIVLGLYFWSETVMLCGWLVDGNADKDIDLVPLYPHFFGDLISSCFPEESMASSP